MTDPPAEEDPPSEDPPSEENPTPAPRPNPTPRPTPHPRPPTETKPGPKTVGEGQRPAEEPAPPEGDPGGPVTEGPDDKGDTASPNDPPRDDGDPNGGGEKMPPARPLPPTPPAAPGLGGAGPGGPTSGLGRTAGRRRGSGVKGQDRWEYWWEYNKDRFLRRIPVGVASGTPGRALAADPREELRRTVLLPALRKAARDGKATIRAGAMLSLGKLGDLSTFADLYRGSKDKDDEVRRAAVLGLSFLGSEDVAPVLQKALLDQDEDRQVRAFAAAGLGLIGSRTSVPFLASVLLDTRESLDVRGAAALGLGFLPGEESREVLQRILSDPRGENLVRAMAANALGRQGRVENVASLVTAMRDRSVEVRRSAVLGLGAVRYQGRAQELWERAKLARGSWIENDALSKEAQEDLERTIRDLEREANREAARVDAVKKGAINALVHAVDKESDFQTQAFAVIGLGEIGSPRGLGEIKRILEKKTHRLKPWAGLAAGISGESGFAPLLKRSFFRRGEDPSIRAAMAIALGLLKDRSFAPQLTRVALSAGEDPDFRGYAVLALGMMWDPRSHDALEKILDTKGNPALHRSAVIALGLTGRSDSGARLVSMMEGSNDLWVKAASTIALGYIRDTRNARALAREAEDVSKPFLARLFSVLALGYVGDRTATPPKLSHLAWHHNYRVRIVAVDRLTSLL